MSAVAVVVVAVVIIVAVLLGTKIRIYFFVERICFALPQQW